MAPKTRGSGRGATISKRKRSERRPVREPSPISESSSSSATPTASPAPTASEIDSLAGRVIATGRKVDFEFLEAEGFLVGRQLLELGWEKICSLDCPTYPSLVKDFYKDLSRGDNGLVSVVRGVRVNVSVEILSRLLHLPSSGPSTFTPEDRSPALSRILNREIVDFEEVQANQLSLELRLLHNICSRVLFPKTGRFDYVSERDIFIMDAVVSGKPINLPNMIIWYMADCGSKRKACLPYGMVLTLIFRSQGVLFSDSEPQRNLRHTDYYSLATIHRMGFVKKNGIWGRKCVSEDRAAPGPSVVHDYPSVPASPAAPAQFPTPTSLPSSIASSSGFNNLQIEQLRSLLDSQKVNIEASFERKFDEIKDILSSLDVRMSSLESAFGASTESLRTDLKKVIEDLGNLGGDSKVYSECNAELQDKIITACAFVDDRLKEFVKTQSEGMRKILDHCQILTRRF